INGHPVQLINEDDQGNPAKTAQIMQTLIGDHVAAIMAATYNDPVIKETVAASNIPFFVSPASSTAEAGPNFFTVGLTSTPSWPAIISTAKQAGAANLGTMVCTEATSCTKAASSLKSAAQKAGFPVVYQAAVSSSAPNYTAQCLAARQAGVKALFLF